MTYRETFLFISQCLTISLEEKNKRLILKQLESKKVDWNKVVKLSTQHYVLPAIYCNLKRVNFLKYLPEDLTIYMNEITKLNRERNKKIILQAKKLNSLLLANNIKPIFIKGTGNLLANLYFDIAERMVGDIDFIFSKKDYQKTIKLLKLDGYSYVKKEKNHFPDQRHYNRIRKKNNIAALEIHHSLINEKYSDEFNYSHISHNSQLINGFKVLSYKNKLILSILSNQINDNGFYYKSMALRNAYDVFLLSKKTNAKNSFSEFRKLQNILNCFLANCYVSFGKIKSLEYNKTIQSKVYLNNVYKLMNNDRKRKLLMKLKYYNLIFLGRISVIYKSFYSKKFRIWILKRIFDFNLKGKK